MRAFPYLHFNAVCAVLVTSAVLAAFVAVWAATSQRHWFWRVLAIWITAVVPIPIRAYELAGILAITLPLLAIAIALINRFLSGDQTCSRSPAIRFSLRDIFLLTLTAALIVAAALHWWRDLVPLGISGGRHWGALIANFALAGTAFWTLTLLTWLTATRYRLLGSLALLAAIPCFAYAIPLLGKAGIFGLRFDYLPPWQALGIDFGNRPLGPAPGILLLVFTEFTIALFLALAFTKPGTHSPTHQSPTTRRWLPIRNPQSAIRICLAIPICFLAILYIQMLRLTPLPPRFSSAPNNYDRLIEIMRQSEQLIRRTPTTPLPKTPNQRQLPALIDEATALLQAENNYLPYDPEKDVATRNRIDHYYVDHHNRLRLFAKKIDDEAELARATGDRDKALAYALANLRLGLMLHRGSTFFDSMFGRGADFLAQKRLASMRRELTSEEALRAIRAADEALEQAEDVPAILARSRAFAERIWGWPSRLDHVLEDFGCGGTGLHDVAYFNAAYQRRESTYRLLQTDLALRLYHADHGAWPQSLDQLVPTYLPATPIDPHTAKPFVYRPDGNDFLLYSVGKDGIDNGGRFTSAAAYSRVIGDTTEHPGYDFDLDALNRP